MNVYMHHVAGSSSYHVKQNLAYDKCPTCEQWYSRHPGQVGQWSCAKCNLSWGASVCPQEGCGGPLADILHVDVDGAPEKTYQVCLNCGFNTNDPKPEDLKTPTDPTTVILNKMGFAPQENQPNVWVMNFVTPMMQGFPQGVQSQLYGRIGVNPEDLENSKIDAQCGNMMHSAFDAGYTMGMISMLRTPIDQKHVFDHILARAAVGQVITYAGTGWVCTKIHNKKKWAEWRSSVGDIETKTEKYKPQSWKDIFKPLFDQATAAEDAKKTPAQLKKEAADGADPLEGQTDEDLGIGSMSVDELRAVEAGK